MVSSVFTATGVEPGVYHYTLSEDSGSYEGIIYDSTAYDIYVFVYQSNGTNYVGNIVSTKTENSTTAKADLTFTNNYGNDSGDDPSDPTSPTPDEKNDSTHDVTFTKAISGNMADAIKEFSFTVGVTGANGEIYKVVYYASSSDTTGTTTNVTSGSTINIEGIKATGSIVIYGLTERDVYSVEETDYTSNGYTTTVSYGSGTTADTNNYDTAKAVGTVSADSAAVTITNTYNVSTPTGVILTYGPYAAMVVIALGACVVFFRRRRSIVD